MKPVLMIHEMNETMFDIDLEKYVLTFDDGLYTQYKFMSHLLEVDTPKFFFISTNIVNETNVQKSDFITCSAAHDLHFEHDDRSHYMTWVQIKEIDRLPNCEIGGHSHDHLRCMDLKCMVDDTNNMMNTFKKNNITPRSFCFPYNDEKPMYRSILQSKGITNFYGSERVDIHEVLG